MSGGGLGVVQAEEGMSVAMVVEAVEIKVMALNATTSMVEKVVAMLVAVPETPPGSMNSLVTETYTATLVIVDTYNADGYTEQ